MLLRLIVTGYLCAAGLGDAAADTPTAAVRAFYDHPGLELDPAARDRFVDPAKSVIEGDEALRQSGQGECLDPRMPVDGTQTDAAEIAGTLKTAEAIKGDTAKVIVAFLADGAPHRLEWKLQLVGQDWKVADILSVSGEWALSQYGCR